MPTFMPFGQKPEKIRIHKVSNVISIFPGNEEGEVARSWGSQVTHSFKIMITGMIWMALLIAEIFIYF